MKTENTQQGARLKQATESLVNQVDSCKIRI